MENSSESNIGSTDASTSPTKPFTLVETLPSPSPSLDSPMPKLPESTNLNDEVQNMDEDICMLVTPLSPHKASSSKDHPVSTLALEETPTIESPEKKLLRRQLFFSQEKVAKKIKKIKTLQQTVRRRDKRIANLKNELDNCQKEYKIRNTSMSVVKIQSQGIQDLVGRLIMKQKGIGKKSYDPDIRAFAMTLHYYSSRAYKYVREKFENCLPHPRTLQKWCQVVEIGPGFTQRAFEALEERCSKYLNDTGKELLCALSVDGMNIKKSLKYDRHRKKNIGFIDFGTELKDDDNLPLASEAMVFMIVAVNSSFKVPVGYFFTDSLDALELENLVNSCLIQLNNHKIRVVSLTFDGLSTNQSMAELLGCCLDSNSLKSVFPHSVSTQHIAVFLDACHMLKCVRNALQAYSKFFDLDGGVIGWEFIEKLVKIQEKEGMNLSNKLTRLHLEFWRKKMNVKLAAQTLSNSTADAIDFLSTQLQYPQFTNSEPTTKFIRIINDLFDIMNTRNGLACYKPYISEWKRPLSLQNGPRMIEKLEVCKKYLLGLTVETVKMVKKVPTVTKIPLVQSGRKTGFIGFITNVDSLIYLYKSLIVPQPPALKYLLTYKLSQDHLELFFGKIRSSLGANTNPTVSQFTSAYKKNLIHTEIMDVTRGNSIPLENMPVLTISSTKKSTISPSTEMINNTSPRNRLLIDIEGDDATLQNELQNDDIPEDYIYIPRQTRLSRLGDAIVGYIAGYVTFTLKKQITCKDCLPAISYNSEHYNVLHEFIKLKSKGWLSSPSDDVLEICLVCEKLFRQKFYPNFGNQPESLPYESFSTFQYRKLVLSVLSWFRNKSIFTCLTDHMLDTDPLENHVVLLIKAVAEKYFDVRFFMPLISIP